MKVFPSLWALWQCLFLSTGHSSPPEVGDGAQGREDGAALIVPQHSFLLSLRCFLQPFQWKIWNYLWVGAFQNPEHDLFCFAEGSPMNVALLLQDLGHVSTIST